MAQAKSEIGNFKSLKSKDRENWYLKVAVFFLLKCARLN